MATIDPTFDDANLVLKLYELRREEVMRTSRNAIIRDFNPKTYDEMLAVTDAAHPLNPAFRQVSSYWEMVYSFVRHGVAHPELIMENSAEGLILYAKVSPFLGRFREEVSPTAFRNAQWVSENTVAGKQRFEYFKKRFMHQSDENNAPRKL